MITNEPTRDVLLAGDFNINFLQDSSDKEELIDLLASFNLKIILREPSRITKSSAACIDNVFSNIKEEFITGTTKEYHLSDHMTQIVKIKRNISEPETKTEIIKFRQIDEIGTNLFTQNLYWHDWRHEIEGKNAEEAYNNFQDVFLYYFDKCFPETMWKIEKREK